MVVKTEPTFATIDLDDYFDETGKYKKNLKIKSCRDLHITRSKNTPLIIGESFLSYTSFEYIGFTNTQNIIEIEDSFLRGATILSMIIGYEHFPDLRRIGSRFLYNMNSTMIKKMIPCFRFAFRNLCVIESDFMAYSKGCRVVLKLPNIENICCNFMYNSQFSYVTIEYAFDCVSKVGKNFLQLQNNDDVIIKTTLDASDLDDKIISKNSKYEDIEKRKIDIINEIGIIPRYTLIDNIILNRKAANNVIVICDKI